LSEHLQLIYYFGFLGVEGKRFLLTGNAILRLLNLVYFQTTPRQLREEFLEEPVMDIELTVEPELGNPINEDPK